MSFARSTMLLLALTTPLLTASAQSASAPSTNAQPAEAKPVAAPDTSPQVTEGVVNAPVAEVWRVFTTNEGFKNLGVAKAEIDFRVGGLMRSHYNPNGVIGDEGTIQNQIIAYEPEHMLAFRIHQPPKGFPFAEAWKNTWSVVTLTDMGNGTTHVRLAGVGYDATEESQKMREFFKAGNAYVMKLLQSKYDAAAAAPTGAAHAQDPLAPIELTQIVNAPRAEVFSWYTTSAGWKAFMGADTKIALTPGGPFEVYFGLTNPEGQRGSEGCTILSYIPNEMVSHTWNAPPTQAYTRARPTWVVVRFDEVSPTTTRVRFIQQGFAENNAKEAGHQAEWAETRAYFAQAWPRVLGGLADHAKSK